MTLFSPEHLKAVFPEADPGSLNNPVMEHYHKLAQAQIEATISADRLKQTGGSHDAIGNLLSKSTELDYLSELDELEPSFKELVSNTHNDLGTLFTETNSAIDLPSLDSPELAHIHWSRLQEGYRAYEALGMTPELVISPKGQDLAKWKGLYSNLRIWQDKTYPDSAYRLKEQPNGDGLYVDKDLESNWDELVDTSSPKWMASVIPATTKAPILEVNHQGMNNKSVIPEELSTILSSLPKDKEGNNTSLVNPSMESYLILQAQHFFKNTRPIDVTIYRSWLDNNISSRKNAPDITVAPYSYWGGDVGQVYLLWLRVDFRIEGLGVRPEVRG